MSGFCREILEMTQRKLLEETYCGDGRQKIILLFGGLGFLDPPHVLATGYGLQLSLYV